MLQQVISYLFTLYQHLNEQLSTKRGLVFLCIHVLFKLCTLVFTLVFLPYPLTLSYINVMLVCYVLDTVYWNFSTTHTTSLFLKLYSIALSCCFVFTLPYSILLHLLVHGYEIALYSLTYYRIRQNQELDRRERNLRDRIHNCVCVTL